MDLKRRMQLEFSFTSSERQAVLSTGFVGALILFMFAWRTTDYANIAAAAVVFLLFFLITISSVFLFVSGAKIIALQKGYRASYETWTSGLLVGFVISFVSYGLLPCIIPGPLRIDAIDRLRHGKTYFGENKKELYIILAAAPLSALLFAALLAVLSTVLGSSLLYYGALFNAFLAFFSLLPLPETLGSVMFFARRTRYFSLIVLTALFLLVLVTKTVLVLLVLLGLALLYWIVSTIYQRKKKK